MSDETTHARVGCGPVGAGIVVVALAICALLTVGSGLVIAFPDVFIDLIDRDDGEPDELRATLGSDGTPTIVPDAGADPGSISNPVAIGETVERGGVAVTVHGVTRATTVAEAVPGDGLIFLVVDVAFVNTGGELRNFNSYYWSARDIIGEGNYDDEKNVQPANAILAGSLASGDGVRGNVLLVVPADAAVLRLKYSTELLGGEDLYWLYVPAEASGAAAATPEDLDSRVAATPASE